MLATSGVFDTLLSGAIPAFGVLIAGAMVTTWRGRNAKTKATAEELAKVKASEVPPWGVELQQQNQRIIRSLYGDPPWGDKGFFDRFEAFQKDMVTRLDSLNGGKQ